MNERQWNAQFNFKYILPSSVLSSGSGLRAWQSVKARNITSTTKIKHSKYKNVISAHMYKHTQNIQK